ncbi:MAG: adenosine deaminase [Verrucomicrobiota bacterium]
MKSPHLLKELRGKDLAEAVDFRALPKVLLHEHLDGGLRPATVVELAREEGYGGLPTEDADELREWFHRGAKRGSLPEYLEGFAHTIAVMQSAEALERVAFEFIEDMAADGVIYAEVRFAPVFHTGGGLTQDEVVAAVVQGLDRGGSTYGVEWGLIICAMRNRQDSREAADLAISWRDRGVVGFDLAGEEAGYPPKEHLDAFQAVQRANFNITIHAGEAFGKNSIWQALQWCGAHRLGHGTRLVEDFIETGDGENMRAGSLARYVRDHRIALEMCLSSNVDTGACSSLETHPFPLFHRRGFRVCLNTDDRLMSNTEMSKEYHIATEAFQLGIKDLERVTLNAMKSAFAPHEKRRKLITEVILPEFSKME